MAELAGHPTIVRLCSIYKLPRAGTFAIVTEHCAGGELFECVAERGRLPEAHACVIMRQVLDALRCVARARPRRLRQFPKLLNLLNLAV
jgi:serine/threonine protein kinase